MADMYRSFFGKQRGNKLWEGNRMILPEHRKYMIELEMHEERFMERAVLDEDKLQEMSMVLSEAIMEPRVVSLRLYDQYGTQSVSILPKGIDMSTRTLKGLSALGERQIKVPLEDILDVVLEEVSDEYE